MRLEASPGRGDATYRASAAVRWRRERRAGRGRARRGPPSRRAKTAATSSHRSRARNPTGSAGARAQHTVVAPSHFSTSVLADSRQHSVSGPRTGPGDAAGQRNGRNGALSSSRATSLTTTSTRTMPAALWRARGPLAPRPINTARPGAGRVRGGSDACAQRRPINKRAAKWRRIRARRVAARPAARLATCRRLRQM